MKGEKGGRGTHLVNTVAALRVLTCSFNTPSLLTLSQHSPAQQTAHFSTSHGSPAPVVCLYAEITTNTIKKNVGKTRTRSGSVWRLAGCAGMKWEGFTSNTYLQWAKVVRVPGLIKRPIKYCIFYSPNKTMLLKFCCHYRITP